MNRVAQILDVWYENNDVVYKCLERVVSKLPEDFTPKDVEKEVNAMPAMFRDILIRARQCSLFLDLSSDNDDKVEVLESQAMYMRKSAQLEIHLQKVYEHRLDAELEAIKNRTTNIFLLHIPNDHEAITTNNSRIDTIHQTFKLGWKFFFDYANMQMKKCSDLASSIECDDNERLKSSLRNALDMETRHALARMNEYLQNHIQTWTLEFNHIVSQILTTNLQ